MVRRMVDVKNEKLRYSVALMTLLIAMPLTASANIVWPSLFIVTGMMSWYIILAGLVIEILFIKKIINPGWVKSIVMSLGMNVASAIIGLLIIPVSGFIAAIVFGMIWNTFDLALWAISYILAVFSNVCIEGLFIKLVFKLPFKKNFLWLLIANSLSVVLAIVVLGFTMPGVMGM